MRLISIFIFLLIPTVLFSAPLDRISKTTWDGIPVVWLKDNKLPLYNLTFYFSDGALSDAGGVYGETNAMFEMLNAGTRRYSRKDILSNLEFYGVSTQADVTHEYTTYSFSGLVKDLIPSVKKICHLFSDAAFPEDELAKEKVKGTNALKNLLASPDSLASRAFRELSLAGTPYYYPVGGKLDDLRKLNSKGLRKKLDYFNNSVSKRIYLSGPKEVMEIGPIINQECGWNGEAKFVRSETFKKSENKITPDIFFITVPNSNQAQVRIGRFLNDKEIKNEELLNLGSGFLGGGFTSKLMREVRVNRGLTYGISSFAAAQKNYGRSGIFTSTKNDSLVELLTVVKNTVDEISKGEFTDQELDMARGYLWGSHPFRFELTGQFLAQLVYLDHVGKDYDELFKFQDRILSFSKEDVRNIIQSVFGWDKQVIVILGDKNLIKPLSALGHVKVIPYNNIL